MVNIFWNKWSLKIRRMGISIPTRKLPLFVIGFVCILIYLFYSKLSTLEVLQEKCINDVQLLVNNNAKLLSLKQELKPLNCPATSSKQKYYLAAQNPNGEFLKHVRNVFQYLGYERTLNLNGDWDVMWAYDYPFSTLVTINSLKPNQLVNHFPGSGYLTSKVYLATSKFKYIPTAFSLPQDKENFLAHVKENKEKLWVQKSNKHRGITIKSIDQLDLTAKDAFVQEFVQNPFLVDKRKFDIGIYTIITSMDPLRVYVMNAEWLMRYCTEDYYPLDVHDPKKYVVGDDYTPTWELPSLKNLYNELGFSHKDSFLHYVRQKGHDSSKLIDKIYTAIAEISHEKKAAMMKLVSKYPYGTNSFFELVRFDFVIDNELNVYLMEVNMSPNLSSAHFQANAIMYEQVVTNTLSLVGLGRPTDHMKTINTIFANERNIQVYGSECLACNACNSAICRLCLNCLSNSQKAMLQSAYREHVNKVHSVRVYPQPSKIQPASDMSYTTLSENDRLMHLWFRGKCMVDNTWC